MRREELCKRFTEFNHLQAEGYDPSALNFAINNSSCYHNIVDNMQVGSKALDSMVLTHSSEVLEDMDRSMDRSDHSSSCLMKELKLP
jgi:hypothetical protein